ncbi:MAG: thermonuclease family protein [Proteobacteria bacterium]|nr:hypothetical protein [Desulfobacula sp.]MBU4132511.1 thermonuclease family protein [Pseudomonadota bacterium]
MKQIWIAIWIAFFMAGSAMAKDQVTPEIPDNERTLEGVIIKVVSPGNLVVWENGRLYPFTLYGIKLPDPDSDQGRQVKKTVSEQVFNKLLSVRLVESDPPRGIVIIRGKCLNETLVRQGVAGVEPACKKEPHCSQWRKAEAAARTAGIGIWKSAD